MKSGKKFSSVGERERRKGEKPGITSSAELSPSWPEKFSLIKSITQPDGKSLGRGCAAQQPVNSARGCSEQRLIFSDDLHTPEGA